MQIVWRRDDNQLDVVNYEQFLDASHELHARILGVDLTASAYDGRKFKPLDQVDKRSVKYLACEPEADNTDLDHPFASREILQD
jgi:hypothetical protein